MRYEATLPNYDTYEEIDSDKGLIKGVSLARVGEAKGHGVMVDSTFLRQIVSQGKENSQGLKARFGHPNMCATALGTYLGRFKNFRKSGDKALADLYLDESAKNTPNGNLYDYVISMAESNQDMFGASIVFKAGEVELKTIKNAEGDKEEVPFARIDTLMAADLVDSPAANESLFSSDELASQVTMFLDTNPKIFEMLSHDESIIDEFLTKYKSYKSKREEMSEEKETTDLSKLEGLVEKFNDSVRTVIEKFSSKPEEIKILDNEDVATQLSELQDKLKEATEKEAEFSALTDKIKGLETELAAAKAGEVELKSSTEPTIEPVDPKEEPKKTAWDTTADLVKTRGWVGQV